MLNTVKKVSVKFEKMVDNEFESAWTDDVTALLNTSRYEGEGARETR
jgi:hypothetical protein